MRLMIDTNIFLDVLAEREPFLRIQRLFWICARIKGFKDFFPHPVQQIFLSDSSPVAQR